MAYLVTFHLGLAAGVAAAGLCAWAGSRWSIAARASRRSTARWLAVLAAALVAAALAHVVPGRFGYWLDLGLIMFGLAALNRGNPSQAIQLIGRALAAAPGFAPAYVNLGNAQRAANCLADACASYRRAIALQPGLHECAQNLGLRP